MEIDIIKDNIITRDIKAEKEVNFSSKNYSFFQVF